MFNHGRKDAQSSLLSIPVKANSVLQAVLLLLLCIGARLWYLSVIQYDKKVEEAFKPRRRVVVEPAERGTIRDRFNVVLAANKIDYRLAIIYSQFREIPNHIYEQDTNGNKVKRFLRKEYIHKLSILLAQVLDSSASRIEDLIHSHASLHNHIPFIVKQGLSEEQYFLIKALEKDWVGIQAERVPKRYYPQGKTAASVIGYLGPIQKEQYTRLIEEINTLSEYIKDKELGLDVEEPIHIESFAEAKRRLFELKEFAYTINDDVGRLGIESFFEEDLRGYAGRRLFFADAKGNALRQIHGSHPPVSGKRLLLSVSVELQEFAEKLLAQSETDREKVARLDANGQKEGHLEPWMRGGAIVAMDPNTAEIVALASYPRYDPNDFIKARQSPLEEGTPDRVLRWIESEQYLGKVWDQMLPLKRELYSEKEKTFFEEEQWLSWDLFLELILPKNSPIAHEIPGCTPIKKIIDMQHAFEISYQKTDDINLDNLFTDSKYLSEIPTNREKLLLLDLSRLVLLQSDFTPDLQKAVGGLSINAFRDLSSAFASFIGLVQKESKRFFRENDFALWRKDHEKEYLFEMRKKEKEQKLSTKPYLDYLDRKEKELFDLFWQNKGIALCLHLITADQQGTNSDENLQRYFQLFSQNSSFINKLKSLPDLSLQKLALLQATLKKLPENQIEPFLKALKCSNDLTFPLWSNNFKGVLKRKAVTAKSLAFSFAKMASPGHFRSFAFRHATTQGSIFKLVTAYAALKQNFEEFKEKRKTADTKFYEIVDQTFRHGGRMWVGYFASGEPIPQIYKGGRIPKSLRSNIGKIDLLRAIETSSNPYFSLLASDWLKDPDDLIEAARLFGYGEKTGIQLPDEISGKLPNDLKTNRTGLYATAIGQHTLVTTPLQTAGMLATIANGGTRFEPKIVNMIAGKCTPFEKHELQTEANFPFKETLQAIGINFPLFSQSLPNSNKNQINIVPLKIRKELLLPLPIRKVLLEGMQRVIVHLQSERTGALGRFYQAHPHMYKDFVDLKGQFIGKSSTAEAQEKLGLDFGQSASMYNHTWFGGISFEPSVESFTLYDVFGKPELVVVVYLRYGSYGKEVAPLAAQIIHKWREIKNKQISLK